MNIKKLFIQASVIYLIMTGVCSATPPFLDPLIIETGDKPLQVTVTNPPPQPSIVKTGDTPLQVTVTNVPESATEPPIRIPFVYGPICNIKVGKTTCSAVLHSLNQFPEGTDLAVIEQFSYKIRSTHEASKQTINITVYTWLNNTQNWTFLPTLVVDADDGNSRGQNTHAVTLYHNSTCSIKPDEGCNAWAEFITTAEQVGEFPALVNVYVTGYYTKADTP